MPDTAHRAAQIPRKPVSRHGRVTAVSMMKDEGPFVLEWVAHHLAVGFTDLVVYTNDCSDGTDDMLIRLEELGLAHHRRNVIPEGVKPQPSALNHAQDEPLVQESDWVMVFDADEFLSIRYGDGTLDGMLDAVVEQGANGLVVTWRIFGSGGIQHWSRDFVTEQYLMAAPPMWNKGWGVKTLFRFDPEAWRLGIHRPKMKNKVLDTDFPHSVKWLNGSGREMEEYFKFRGWRSIVRTVGYDWAQMNHYAVKSIDSYAMRKFRGNVNNKKDKYNNDYWSLQDRNEVRDDTMLRYTATRRALFDGLLADPVLNRLHHAALERAEAKLAAFKGSAEYEAFVEGLRVASEVPITAVSAKPPKARDKQAIAEQMSDMEKRAALTAKRKRADPIAEGLEPSDLYVGGDVDPQEDVPLEWHLNHSALLPADPRIFSPPALLQIAEGKFQRNLARNLPGLLPEGGHYAQIGTGSGFLGTHLALTREDARVTLQEPDPKRRTFIERLWARNEVTDGARHSLTDQPVLDADLLALGDPDLTPDWLAKSAVDAPRMVLLIGRLWPRAFADLIRWESALKSLGYIARLKVDPSIGAAYARPTSKSG